MLAELTERLIGRWDVARFGRAPRTLSYLGVAGRVEGGTTSLLAFADGDARPRLAVKIHRRDDGGAAVRSEAAILERLHGRADLAGSVPEVVLAERIAGSWILVQSAFDGPPLRIETDLRRRAQDAERVFRWLARLPVERGPDAAGRIRRRALALSDELRGTVGDATGIAALVAAIDVDTVAAQGAVVAHGDLTPHNILVTHGGLAVIDWTDARDDGFALEDALLFLSHLYVLRARSGRDARSVPDAFARAFVDRGPERDAVRALVRHQAAALGIPAVAVPHLLTMSFVALAASEARRLRDASDRGSWPLFALHRAAAEGLERARIAETVPWVSALGVLAAHDGLAFR